MRMVIIGSRLPRRGLGATTATPATSTPQNTLAPVIPTPIIAASGPATAPTRPAPFHPWISGGWTRQTWPQGFTPAQPSTTTNLQVTQPVASTAPTSATMDAFIAALNSAVQGGLITATQDGAYQTQAQNSTDSQVQDLTAQLDSLNAAAPSATATAASSWWNGSTVLFGNTIQNSTLAIGGVVAFGLGWLIFKKK